MFIFGACGGKTKSYIRTWIEQQESVLILKDDGTCKYKDGGDDETEKGTWEIPLHCSTQGRVRNTKRLRQAPLQHSFRGLSDGSG